MLKVAAAVALAVPMALLAVVAGTGVLVVDVRESGPDGHHIVVPVPLLLVQAAASFVPADQVRVRAVELDDYLPLAREVVDALADAPDAELVRVEDRGETVLVEKAGDTLHVGVHGRNEDVEVNVPLEMVIDVLEACRGGRVDAAEVVGALRHARMTRIVDVRDGGDHVKVTVW